MILNTVIPLSVQIHVRAKNVNGWSQWSNYGYIMDVGGEWNNELYVWLYYHSMEHYYQKFADFGILTVEELMKLSSSDIGSTYHSCDS